MNPNKTYSNETPVDRPVSPYGVNELKGTQLLIAGLVSSAAMLIFSYLIVTLGIPAPDYLAQHGTFFNEGLYPEVASGAWWAGFAIYAAITVLLLPLVYDYFGSRGILTNRHWLKGTWFGFAIWFLHAAMIAPSAGDGFFFRNLASPIFIAASSLACWLVYGFGLDVMTRVRAVHHLGIAEKRAA